MAGRLISWIRTTSGVSAEIRSGLGKHFSRGHNILFMDPYDDPHWAPVLAGQGVRVRDAESVRQTMGQTRSWSQRIDLSSATPRPEWASTGYCLAAPGTEYLIYLPDGKEVVVDLSGASYPFEVEWFEPSTAHTQKGRAIQGGGKMRLTAPFNTDNAVLYLKRAE